MAMKIGLLVLAVGAKGYMAFGSNVVPNPWLSTFLTGFIVAAVIYIGIGAAEK